MQITEDIDKLVSNPEISILCITFNQVEYVKRCLEGFLAQRIDAPIEILVNDDCSTDGTTDILLKYQREHPELFRIVTHDENQYSRGKSPMGEFLVPLARGSYIAMCEGDDFWTDPTKLQVQLDFMESHPAYACCVHANEHVRAESGAHMATIRYASHDCEVSIDDITSRSQCYATNSMFVRSSAMRAYRDSQFFTFRADGDHKMLLYFGLVAGGIYYLDRVMSAYRMLSKSSVNRKLLLSGNLEENARRKRDQRISLLKFADSFTEGDYHAQIAHGIDSMEYGFARDARDLQVIRRRWPDRLRKEGLLAHVDLYLYTYCRPLHRLALRMYMR